MKRYFSKGVILIFIFLLANMPLAESLTVKGRLYAPPNISGLTNKFAWAESANTVAFVGRTGDFIRPEKILGLLDLSTGEIKIVASIGSGRALFKGLALSSDGNNLKFFWNNFDFGRNEFCEYSRKTKELKKHSIKFSKPKHRIGGYLNNMYFLGCENIKEHYFSANHLYTYLAPAYLLYGFPVVVNNCDTDSLGSKGFVYDIFKSLPIAYLDSIYSPQ